MLQFLNLRNNVCNMIADSRGYTQRKKLICSLRLQKGLQVVCETFQSDSISPKATISGCHRGNSFDGSLSSQTSQERGPSHSRYMIAMLRTKTYPQSPKIKYALQLLVQHLFLRTCVCMMCACSWSRYNQSNNSRNVL